MRPIIPIDPTSHVVGQVVWRLSQEERAKLEGLYHMSPAARLMRLMQLITTVARRDGEVRDLLQTPGVFNELKQMAVERKEQDESGASEKVLSPA